MNFKIDTENKTISINEAVNISQLVKILKSWFPDGEWKKYELSWETYFWSNPLIIQRPYWYDTPPIFSPYITTTESGTGTMETAELTTNFCVSLTE